MSDLSYKRTIQQLRGLASMFWPPELSEREAELSVIPKLVETQDQFISVLSIDVPSVEDLFRLVRSSSLRPNMFLKHLVVLADFGAENLMRVNREFASLFPSRRMEYLWKEEQHAHVFKALPTAGQLNNRMLGISGKQLLQRRPLSRLLQDVTALLMFGSACVDENAARVLAKCEIGNYLGQPDVLLKFVKQRYIWVSRITGGAQAQTLGDLAQGFVYEYLKDNLGIQGIRVESPGSMPGITDREARESPTRLARFDIVIANGTKHAGVEVSFQVTTNSTIERKANEARSRFEQVEEAGYKIAYVIDGAGNFQRESAIRTLCSNSHCTVAFSRAELGVLCRFLRSYFGTSSS